MTATQNYRIDGFVGGLAMKAPCRSVALTNITLSGVQTVGGVAVVTKDRVLVMGQTDPIENGIYNVSASAWTRAPDFDGNRDIVKGTQVPISLPSGTDGINQSYKVETVNPITIGTTAIVFSRADGAGIATVGDKDTSLTVGIQPKTLNVTAALTANRTCTLVTTNAINGDKFRIVRTGLGAFTYDVGGLKTIANSTAAFVDVEFNGSAWILTGYGDL